MWVLHITQFMKLCMWHCHSKEGRQNNTAEQEGEPNGLYVRYCLLIPTSQGQDVGNHCTA